MAQALFSTVLSPAQFTVVDNNSTLSLALGATTLVICTGSQSITFVGFAVPGGNIDGMVVAIQNIGATFAFTFPHESGSAAAANRFRNASFTSKTILVGAGTIWYRYNSSVLRWIHMGSAV